MSVINTNITSLIAQGNLGRSQSALQTSMERLSSGLRINSAKDDAAGQAIANRMTAQITGLQQAQRNANDGISLAQTAEGSLNQVTDNLQRIRELTVQAQNGTNTPEDLQSIQDEITQRLSEIDRISAETSFNGVKVLAEDQGLKIQVGANDGEAITVNLKQINASTLALSSFDVRSQTLDTNSLEGQSPITELAPPSLNVQEISFNDNSTAAAGTFEIHVNNSDPSDILIVNTATNEGFTATYNAATGQLEFDSTATAAATNAAALADYAQATGEIVVGQDAEGNDVIMDSDDIETNNTGGGSPVLTQATDGSFYVSLNGAFHAVTGIDTDVNSATYGQVEFDSSAAVTTAAATGSSALTGPVVINPDDGVEIDFASMDSALVGDSPEVYEHDSLGYVVKGEVDGQTVYYQATVNTENGEVELGDRLNADPLASLDAALNQVDSLKSELGAIQNRFEDAITNLNTNSTNLSAARSRIEDADYAVEVSNMTRAQILQQAGTSVLAQANQIPQIALSLLG